MTKNDSIILELKERIAKKKLEIGNEKKFQPITNCSLELHSKRYNLHTLNKEELSFLLVVLTSYSNVNVPDHIIEQSKISGYSISDWIIDIRHKLDSIVIREKKAELLLMEKALDDLLSKEKQTELTLAKYSKLLE